MNVLFQLIVIFFKIGLFSIGGGYAVIPLIRQQVVDRLDWVSLHVFTDIITISQMTPGPLAVNTSTFIGIQIAGIPGAVFATLGCVISGILISVGLYRFFRRFRRSSVILDILNGLKASSLGLIASAAISILLLAFTGTSSIGTGLSFDWTAALLFLCSFLALRRWKCNPIAVMLAAGVIGFIMY